MFRLSPPLEPFRLLPDELVQAIFLLCLPSPGRRPSKRTAPLLLCHVCPRWRYIAFDTSPLWDDLLLDSPQKLCSEKDEGSARERISGSKERIREADHAKAIIKFTDAPSFWLWHCKRRPFHLTLDWTNVPNVNAATLVYVSDVWRRIVQPTITNIAQPPTTNLRSLDIRVREAHHMNALFTPPAHILNSLEAVSFEVFYVIQNQNMRFFNLTSARKLRKLRVRTYELILSHPSRLRVPWGQLTHLALETRLSLLSWHHVIRATPLLQKCHVYFIGFNPEPNEDVPVNHENDIAALRTLTPRTVTLHHLRELVTTFTGPFSSAIFSDVSCPRLQTLKVANSLVGCGFQSDDLPLDFFKKTAPSLTSLMLSHTEMSADQLLRVLRHAPRITELRIDCEGDHDKLLKALTISRDAEILLPRLITFHMSAVSYFRLDEEGIPPTFSAHVFAEAIRSRWYYAKIEGRPFQAGLFIDDRLTRQRKLRNVEASLSGCKAEGLDLTTGTVVNLKNVKRNTVDPRGDYPWGFRFTDWLEWRTEY